MTKPPNLPEILIDFGNGFELNLSAGIWREAGLKAAIAASSGYGKTHLMIVLLETLAQYGVPFMAIDPKGGYRALKKLPNAKITLVRSRGGDIALDTMKHEWMDEVIYRIGQGHGVVVDMSHLASQLTINSEVTMVYTRLMQKLYRTHFELWDQGRPRSMVLFIDEATIFAPQKWQTDLLSVRMTDQIARMGRTYGINWVIATQRPNDIEKNVLAMSNLRFVGYLGHEPDYKAVESLLGAGNGLPRNRQRRTPPGVRGPVQGRITHQDLLSLRPGEFYAVLGNKRYEFPRARKRITPDLERTPPLLQRTLFDLEDVA